MTRSNAKRVRVLLVLLLSVVLVICFVFLNGAQLITDAFAADTNPNPTNRNIHYYTYDVNNNNFAPSVYTEWQTAVANGDSHSLQDFVFRIDEQGNVLGNFVDHLHNDPAFAGAITTDILSRTEVDWYSILGNRWRDFTVYDKDHEIGRLPYQLHLAFLKDYSFWDQTVKNVLIFLKSGTIRIEEISSYTSSMYMIEDLLESDKPMVIVRNSTNAGGHVLIFDLGKAGTYQYRLECGYQPINPDYWPVPDGSEPVPDNPEPSPEPTPQPTPQPDPEPSPEPSPQPTPRPDNPEPSPDPTPELEPKDPSAGPQDQTDGKNPDYGGEEPQNENPDTTQDNEPVSPDSYTPPPAPTPVEQPSNSGEYGGGSGSPTVERDNGTTEHHNGQDYEVTAGDGQSHTDLSEVQQDATPDTVEESLQGDDTNTGDIAPPE